MPDKQPNSSREGVIAVTDADASHISGLIDIGANLAHESFARDLDAVLQRAWHAGLGAIILTGSCLQSSERTLEMARQHPGKLYSTVGLHPHHASDWSSAMKQRFEALAAADEVVSLGECGLDYYRDLSPRPVQQQAFIDQIQLAIRLGKPLFLHQRQAHEDFIAILREHRSALGAVVVHCFTDTRESLEDYLALDCHIGITGWICDERRGRHLLDCVHLIPGNRLMIETDAPYLLPRTAPKAAQKSAHRRNEPHYLPYVLQAVAAARSESPDITAAQTTATAKAFFGI